MYIAGSGTPYWYEWEIGLLECLKMMTDQNVQSVVLQSVDFQSLDDVVVNYNDGSIINIQVKHTDISENFTYSTLTNDSPSMLEKWVKEWNEAKSQHIIKGIRIVTNRKWGPSKSENKCSFKSFVNDVWPQFQKDFGYQSSVESENIAIDWFKSQIKYLGQDAFNFIKILNFYQEEDLQGVEDKIRRYVAQLLGTDRSEIVEVATNRLLSKLSYWATSRRERQEIFREDIYSTLCVDSVEVPVYEIYPEKPVFPSRRMFAELFIDRLKCSDKKVTFVQGLPGSGKTNFVSYLAQLDNSIVDFRFYTYLPVNKKYPSFSDDAGYYTGDLLWQSILHQLKKYFEKHNLLCELGFPLIYNYLSVSEMRNVALKYLPEYAKAVGRTCYLFIDGLDHAARARDAHNSFLSQLPLPDEIDGDVKIILVGQPVNDKYPRGLINNSQVDYVELPMLDEADIELLLLNENVNIVGIDTISLAKSIIDVVGNNALNVLFAIREVRRFQGDYNFDSIIVILQERKLNSQIDKYYDWIVSSIKDNGPLLFKIKIIFAFASQKMNAIDISKICGAEVEEVVFLLNQLYPIIEYESQSYYVFHNDVRLFFKELMISNSNYEALATSIYKKITENEDLAQYKYDIAFEMSYKMNNKQFVFDLFSVEYIIKSIQYKISVNKLIQQFNSLTQLMVDMNSLENIEKISFAASTISQYINNIQYNEKESIFYDEKNKSQKTESEKYILSVQEKIKTIVYDISDLLKNGFVERAKSVFNEYLNSTTLNDFLYGNQDITDAEYYERAGYICRFFSENIMDCDIDVEDEKYSLFVNGWLDASAGFISAEDINKTFTFKHYYPIALNKYTVDICDEKNLEANTFEKLREIYLSGTSNKPIASIIELCAYGILYGYNVAQLQDAISLREKELLEAEEFKHESEKILYYIKCQFCLYNKFKDLKEIPQLYLDIIQRNYIKPESRGYLPAVEQYKLAKLIISDYFIKGSDSDKQIETIYDTVYFVQKYGTGSCHDCDAYSVIKFLKKIIFFTHLRKNKAELSPICKGIKDIFIWDNSKYVKEMSELFYLADDKEDFLDITEHWCGPNGILWDCSYSDVEYIGKDITHQLYKFGLNEMAQKIEKCILFKLFGYVGHKDYSLNGLLECYEYLPLSEDKLYKYGMSLLTISDKAYAIGDNRMASRIESVLFETAVDLGIKHVNALFELKNKPKEFYDWRNYFLNAYFKKLSTSDLPDSELVALYNIVNTWINEEIETSIQRGGNQIEHLLHYNYRIIENVNDDDLCQKLKSLKKYEPKVSVLDTDEFVIKLDDYSESIIRDTGEKGYSNDIEQRIAMTFSDRYGKQSKLLLQVGAMIDISQNSSFISNCVIEYIVKRREYGYRGSGLEELIRTFHSYFSFEDWTKLFENIVHSAYPAREHDFYNISEDIETLCLYYFKGIMPEKLTTLYDNKAKTHWCWLTSCGETGFDFYQLLVDESINSLSDFWKYQFGKDMMIL